MCKKLHGGSLTTLDELTELVKSWKGTEKSLHTSLNLEIRLRKLTLTKVKADCLLFKQMKLSIKEKERNLRSLIDSQLDFKTLAEMSDLEADIVGSSNVEEQSNVEDEDGANLELRNDAYQQANQDDVHSMRPPNEEQFIIG